MKKYVITSGLALSVFTFIITSDHSKNRIGSTIDRKTMIRQKPNSSGIQSTPSHLGSNRLIPPASQRKSSSKYRLSIEEKSDEIITSESEK